MGLFNGLSFNGGNVGLQSNHLSGLAAGLLSNEIPEDSEAFITIWNTKNTSTGSSTAKQIKLPLVATGSYNFTVEWGDGTRDIIRAYNAAAVTHTYHTAGIYKVKIKGVCTSFVFNPGTTDTNKILEVVQWGTFKVLDSYSFNSCINLRLDNTRDILDVGGIIALAGLFQYCTMTYIRGIGDINLNGYTNQNLGYMFQQNSNFNDTSIVKWDTSKVNTLIATFLNCTSFNQDISNWNTGGCVTMQGTFNGATSFNQPIGNWNVSFVTTMSTMFGGASSFNQPLSGWNVSNVTNMGGMFQNATVFNQPIGNWNVSKVTNLSSMFAGADAFNQNIGDWNVSACTSFTSFMNTKTPSTFSTANLDAIYNGWIQYPLQPNMSISFGTANYTAASTEGKALLTRANLTLGVTNAVNNGTGLIRITTNNPHGLTTGNKTLIFGVSGTTEANGVWVVTTINTTTIDLQASTFTNAYTSGGVVKYGYGWTITDGGQV